MSRRARGLLLTGAAAAAFAAGCELNGQQPQSEEQTTAETAVIDTTARNCGYIALLEKADSADPNSYSVHPLETGADCVFAASVGDWQPVEITGGDRADDVCIAGPRGLVRFAIQSPEGPQEVEATAHNADELARAGVPNC